MDTLRQCWSKVADENFAPFIYKQKKNGKIKYSTLNYLFPAYGNLSFRSRGYYETKDFLPLVTVKADDELENMNYRVFGEYRAPTGIGRAATVSDEGLGVVRKSVEAASEKLGRRIKILVGKPGLDGHSNGAEQIAVRARDCGMEVVYEGIRLTPSQIVRAALDESVHVVGLSILSGSHLALVRDVMDRMRADGMSDIPVVVGGIIPPEDARALKAMGVAGVYTPKDFQINDIMADIVRLVERTTQAA